MVYICNGKHVETNYYKFDMFIRADLILLFINKYLFYIHNVYFKILSLLNNYLI